jgi:hypothetical protein
MSRLLTQIATSKPKVAFQAYTLQHGIEKLSIVVPLAAAATFEQRFNALTDRSKSSIISLIESVNGKVKG